MKHAGNVALRTSAVYGIVGVIWILLSDRLLEILFASPATIQTLQTYKGWTFVAVTALLLYVALRGQLRRREEQAAARQQAEEALRDSREQLALAIEGSGVGLWDWYIQTGGLTLNARWAEMVGYSLQELEPISIRTWASLAHPEDLAHSESLLQKHFAGESPVYECEARMRHKDGRWIWVLDRGRVTERAADSTPLRMTGTHLDITERKQAEERLRESEARYRALVETSYDWVWEVDAQARYTFASPKVREILGYAPEEVVGMTPFDLMPEAEAKRVSKIFSEIAGARRPFAALENVNRHRDGRLVVLETSGMPIVGPNGEFRGYRGMDRDITERQRLGEQLRQAQKMEAIGRLAGGVAHDFNNLLVPILGYGELLRDGCGPGDTRRPYAEEICGAGLRGRDLVRQLLAFSRRQALELRAVDLNTVVTGFEKLLRRTIRENIEIRTALGPRLPAIRADIGQLEQVLMNLAVNAQDAMPGGGQLLIATDVVVLDDAKVAEQSGMRPGEYVRLLLHDTGCGMSAATLQQIFEPFFTTKEQGKGTGLGLSTVYGIVRQHGGLVEVDSAPGRGATFSIYFPAASEHTDTPTAPGRAPRRASPGGCVLVAEDNDVVRSMVTMVLRQHGYTVLAGANGPDCLRLLADHSGPLDLLLTDVIMPGMHGTALFAAVAERYPTARVIYMSGYSDEGALLQGVEKGVPFLQKPFTIQGLLAKVQEALAVQP